MSKVQNSNIQDSFFNQMRKDRAFVTIYLVNGIKLTGKIRSFDKFTVILENKNQEQMIFKHAISTVSPQRPHSNYPDFKQSGADSSRD
jgi:host factor-I protein